ncbi:MAG: hypothetical protein Q7T11_03045 [Deltaproteobacteria bacterium]|nr:hypothetical protein [Deltaproteobacteria bacterium]
MIVDGRISSIRFNVNEPPAGRIDQLGPHTFNLSFVLGAITALRERVANPQPNLEEALLAAVTASVLSETKVLVPLSQLIAPDALALSTARLSAIESRASSISPSRNVEEDRFVRGVSKAILARKGKYQNVTGNETSLAELRAHGGIDASAFDHYYRVQERGGTKWIDLEAIYKGPSVDHGTDPIRNLFHVWLIEAAGGYRIEIRPHVDENFGWDLLEEYFAMNEAFLNEGLPVSINKEVQEVARGEAKVTYRANDPKLITLGIKPEVAIPFSRPLTASAPPSLLPFDQFFGLTKAEAAPSAPKKKTGGGGGYGGGGGGRGLRSFAPSRIGGHPQRMILRPLAYSGIR